MSFIKSIIKRFLPLTLALLLVASSGVMASAKSFTDVSDNYDYKEQIDILSDIGIVIGTTENEFSPDTRVTREQMAMMLFRLMLGRNNPGTVNSTSFNDLYDETYNGAISWANAAGYIIGTSPSTFDPTGGIELKDAMTMLVRALGQSSSAMDKGYPWTYIDAAVKLGLDNGLEKVEYNEILTRGQVAAILYNAISAEYLIVRTGANGNTYVESTTIIESVYGYEIENAVLVATNNYAIGVSEPVVKNGYVSFMTEGGKVMTVDFEDTNLDGSADSWLGREVKLIFSTDKNTKLVSVLGTSVNGKNETINNAALASDNSHVEMNGVKYTIVEELSDKLGTNKNEILFYVFDNDGTLTQLTNNASLASLLGNYEITLIYDDANSDVADRALLKPFTFAKVEIAADGKINIAGNLKKEELTGGMANADTLKSGDYVLSYFNSANKSLEIKETLPVIADQLVTKISADKAIVGGKEYTLGNSLLGISAESIRNSLTLGAKANIVVVNDSILAVPASTVVTFSSQYLILTTAPVPVYTNGALRYVATANINGTTEEIFVSSPSLTANLVYRFTVDANGIYSLTEYSAPNFTQTGEIADMKTEASEEVLAPSANGHFSFNGKNFVTDANSTITVMNNGKLQTVSGKYASTINIAEGATVTAVYSDEIGNVETLMFMYVSNGSLGSTVYSNSSVKVLSKVSAVLIDGKVFTEYTVFNYATGKTEEAFSEKSDLVLGNSYVLDADGRITDKAAEDTRSGLVTGYTGSTVTINGTIYKLSADFKAVKIAADFVVSGVDMPTAYMNNVEFITDGSEIFTMIVNGFPVFTAAQDERGIKLTSSVSLEGLDASALEVVSVTERNPENITHEMSGDNAFILSSEEGFAEGVNTIIFKVNGISYAVTCEITNSAE